MILLVGLCCCVICTLIAMYAIQQSGASAEQLILPNSGTLAVEVSR